MVTLSSNPRELILCIMLCAIVNGLCELVFDVWTQCCLADHVKKCKPEYIANVMLKIYAKLGGLEHLPGERRVSEGLPYL
jgi:hypothetical protein